MPRAAPLPPPRTPYDVPLHTLLKWGWWPSSSSYLRTPFASLEVLLAPRERRVVAMRPGVRDGAAAVGWRAAHAATPGSRGRRNHAAHRINRLVAREGAPVDRADLVDRADRPIDLLIVESRELAEARGPKVGGTHVQLWYLEGAVARVDDPVMLDGASSVSMSAAAAAIAWAERYWMTTNPMIYGRDPQLRDWARTIERARARIRSAEQARIARGWPLYPWAQVPTRERAAQNAVAATLALGIRIGGEAPREARAAIERYGRLDAALLDLDRTACDPFRYEPEYVERASCFVSAARDGLANISELAAHHVEQVRPRPRDAGLSLEF